MVRQYTHHILGPRIVVQKEPLLTIVLHFALIRFTAIDTTKFTTYLAYRFSCHPFNMAAYCSTFDSSRQNTSRPRCGCKTPLDR